MLMAGAVTPRSRAMAGRAVASTVPSSCSMNMAAPMIRPMVRKWGRGWAMEVGPPYSRGPADASGLDWRRQGAGLLRLWRISRR